MDWVLIVGLIWVASALLVTLIVGRAARRR